MIERDFSIDTILKYSDEVLLNILNINERMKLIKIWKKLIKTIHSIDTPYQRHG